MKSRTKNKKPTQVKPKPKKQAKTRKGLMKFADCFAGKIFEVEDCWNLSKA